MTRKGGVPGRVQMVLALGGGAFSVFLVYSEIRFRGSCPGFAGIPACFIVLAAFIAIVASRLPSHAILKRLLFAGGSTTGIVLGLWFTVNELLASHPVCPRTWGIPLCFVSLAVFAAIVVLNIPALQLVNKPGGGNRLVSKSSPAKIIFFNDPE